MMEYNTQQRRLPLPEYGRGVQKMVDHALTIEDREERQRCANTIVKIMRGMFPQFRDPAQETRRLWDHLAIMSGFRLDIDWPVEIVRQESLAVKPERVAYPRKGMKCRHYGRLVQEMTDAAAEMEDPALRGRLVNLIANRMKRDYTSRYKDATDARRLAADITELSDGRLEVKPEDIRFFEVKTPVRKQKQNGGDSRQKRKPNG